MLDSKETDGSLKEFLSGEVRYASLKRSFPEEAEALQAQLEEEVTARYSQLRVMADPTVVCPQPEEQAEE